MSIYTYGLTSHLSSIVAPTWSYILVTPENIRQIPRPVLNNDLISIQVLAYKLQRLDVVRVSLGGERWLFRKVLLGVKMYGRVERGEGRY